MMSISHMLVEIDLPQDKQSFTITAMTSQWHAFLHEYCGVEKPDPKLVLAFTTAHAKEFTGLLAEMKIEWNAFQGDFLALTKDWIALKAEADNATMASMLAWMWKDAADAVEQQYEQIELAFQEEAALGLS